MSAGMAAAAPVTCTGSNDPSSVTSIRFSASSGTCTIVDSLAGSSNGITIAISPLVGTDEFIGATLGDGLQVPPASSDSFSIGGTAINLDGAGFQFFGQETFTGDLLAILIGTVPNFGQFRMEASLTFIDDLNVRVNSASVASVSMIPLPAGLALMLSALGVLGVAGWRRRATA